MHTHSTLGHHFAIAVDFGMQRELFSRRRYRQRHHEIGDCELVERVYDIGLSRDLAAYRRFELSYTKLLLLRCGQHNDKLSPKDHAGELLQPVLLFDSRERSRTQFRNPSFGVGELRGIFGHEGMPVCGLQRGCYERDALFEQSRLLLYRREKRMFVWNLRGCGLSRK
jgi:hypothetical protein